MNFNYVIEKIKNAKISKTPFEHILINDLFKKEDFEKIIQSPEIKIKAKNDELLFEELFANNYRIIDFPGCTQDFKKYIKWHKNKKKSQITNSSCEGYGVVLRLECSKTSVIELLQEFLNSQEFISAMATKFNINADTCNYDAGIQKYLDGYEISPHPDVRRKALTYMVNLNPSPTSFDDEHHTSYLQFKPEWNYIKEFWKGNKELERCWVPWSWCDIQQQQRNNNSIVIFSPNNESLHAVKANYNHLSNQRTQIYGNLWFKEYCTSVYPRWEDYIIDPSKSKPISIIKASAKRILKKCSPINIVKAIKEARILPPPPARFKFNSREKNRWLMEVSQV